MSTPPSTTIRHQSPSAARIVAEAAQYAENRARSPGAISLLDFDLENFQNEGEDVSVDRSPFADDITSLFEGFSERLERCGCRGVDEAVRELGEHIMDNKTKKVRLMRHMDLKRIVIPYVSLDLSSEMVDHFNSLDEDDPRLGELVRKEAAIDELATFLDRFDACKEIVAVLVWSERDCRVTLLPEIGVNPYPLCLKCCKSFGMSICGGCRVARYCSEDCQKADWEHHKPFHQKYMRHALKHHLFVARVRPEDIPTFERQVAESPAANKLRRRPSPASAPRFNLDVEVDTDDDEEDDTLGPPPSFTIPKSPDGQPRRRELPSASNVLDDGEDDASLNIGDVQRMADALFGFAPPVAEMYDEPGNDGK